MFLINGITREITSDAPKEDFLFGVTSDEKANIKYFKGPRYTKNSVDLASASIRINYINGGAETDQYIVTDLEADEEYITFSWTFHRNVTKYKGAVQFIVCAVKCDADGSITNEWNTTSAKGTVQQGIEVDGSEYEEETADAIESILLAAQNRINAMVVDDTLSQAGVAADAAATGAAIESLTKEIENQNGTGTGTGLSTEAIDKLEEVGNYLAYTTADGGSKWTELISILRNGSSGDDSGDEDDSGDTTVTLTSISATYTGGNVAVGTALTSLTGLTVKATYSDGSTKTVTCYTLSGTIAEGTNTITVSYGGKTTTFTVTGVAEESYVELSNSADLWEVGGVQPVGSGSTSTTRLRTVATLPYEVKKISVDDGYSYILVVYSEAQTEVPTDTNTVLLTGKGYYNPNGISGNVSADAFLVSIGTYFNGELLISEVRANINSMYGDTNGDAAHFRILLKNNDDATLTADDGLHIHLWG